MDEFFCWPYGDTEESAKIIKAENANEAAKAALDVWRHEGRIELRMNEIIVNVKDPEGWLHKITINQENFRDSAQPQA